MRFKPHSEVEPFGVFIGSHQAAGHRFILKRDQRHGGARASSNEVDCLEIRHVKAGTAAESAAWN
jgi:hypothetical protein